MHNLTLNTQKHLTLFLQYRSSSE